ncbi:hypothetical protein BEN47_15315 [Hymenobacter lapidarius]|uniref:Uncharacterized protein n=1 Tax=Hymenobacter lapidarius TaxID=1908237 RepID=A0A1G1T2I0_9BACT|nr:DUF3883 domain-containing protein [Hymenobacter lapidarius]OGX85085.1 hypothetical protein BEN47_15315 [Hymenobacter lapidarius]
MQPGTFLPHQSTVDLELSDLIAKSKALRTALRDKDSDLSTVLSELYSEKAHFLYELLQNAEDAGATSMEILLLPTELVVRHNGRVFNVQDVKAITGISNTSNAKKKDRDKIGRFGIGFKSVFKITTRPRIQSGEFDFEIEDYIVPVLASESSSPATQTIITLPFAGSEQEQADTYQALAIELQTLDAHNLLFLRKLGTLEFRWDVHTRKLHRQSKRHGGQDFATQVTLSDEGTGAGSSQQYLLFQVPVRHLDFQQLPTPQYVALAFQLGTDAQGATQLVPARSGFVFVFFATRYPTHLKFLVHAPFVTTPSREFLKMDARVNDALVEELGDLQRLVLPYLKKHKLLTVPTLCLMPVVSPEKITECPPLYRKLFAVMREELVSEQAFLPILNQQFHQPAARLLLAGSKELVTLLSAREQLNALWPGHTHWLPTTITAEAAATRDLYAYLKQELKIREIDPADAIKLCTPAFLARQKALWMQQFYGFLAKNRPTWWQSKSINNSRTAGFLRTQPIMRLPGNRYLSPFDDADRLQVFLPLGDEDDLPLEANCLDPAAIDSKPARHFLSQLGIKKPDLFDEARLRILPLYRQESGPNYKQHLRHCRLLVKVFNQGGERQRELLALLRDPQLRFVRPRGPATASGRFCSYTEAYLPCVELESYFQLMPRVRFVDEGWYDAQGIQGWRALLQACGFKHEEPWIRKFDPRFPEKYLLQLRKQQHTNHSTTTTSYKLEGLSELLQSGKLTPELSWLAWRLVTRACRGMQGRGDSPLLGKHEWFYKKWEHAYFPSQLRQLLESEKWLWVPAENGVAEWRTLLETEPSQLPSAYEQENDGARFLLQQLAWKSDARTQLEQKMSAEELTRWRAYNQAISEGLDVEAALREQRAKQKTQREQDQRCLDEAPPLNASSFVERPFVPAAHTQGSDIGTRLINVNKADGTTNAESSTTGSPAAPSKILRDGIGQRGEDVVWQVVQQQYDSRVELKCVERTPTAVRYWHADEQEHYVLELGNTETHTSVGHDLLVRRGSEIIRYIEVKATASSTKAEFAISARQWAVATGLWKQGLGSQFELWVVRDALSEAPSYTTIDDPVSRWRSGEFGAAPVVIVV